MKSPRHPPGNPDRHLECQEALEARISAIVEEGRAAGWTISDITVAIVALADNLMLADAENRKLEQEIEAALRRRGL